LYGGSGREARISPILSNMARTVDPSAGSNNPLFVEPDATGVDDD